MLSSHSHAPRRSHAAVCPEPKVFVGQLPLESSRDQVTQLFSQYGNIKNCVIITHADGRSKGAAMVLYDTWAEAELAIETENGTMNLGGSRPLVVRFADPPKRGDGPIMGIAPRKLFVGQVRSARMRPACSRLQAMQ